MGQSLMVHSTHSKIYGGNPHPAADPPPPPPPHTHYRHHHREDQGEYNNVVTYVHPDSVAEDAGLKQGDIILSINGISTLAGQGQHGP
jgi:hypothetical protein